MTTDRSRPEIVARRPRFVHAAVLVQSDGGFVVDGTHQRLRIHGRSASWIVKRLIPLLDGSRDADEIERAVPHVDPTDVRAAIAILTESGLIEEGGPDNSAGQAVLDEVYKFLQRFHAVTGVNRSGAEALRKLAEAKVIVVAEVNDCSVILQSLLANSGVGDVRLVAIESLDSLSREAVSDSQALIVSMSPGGRDSLLHRTVDRWATDHGIPWLRSVIRGGPLPIVDVGPLFTFDTPCFECFEHISELSFEPQSERCGEPGPAEGALAASVIAIEIVYGITRVAPRNHEKTFRRYFLKDLASRDLCYFRVPGCERCRPVSSHRDSATATLHVIDSAVAFEDVLALENRNVLDPATEKVRTRVGAALSHESKQLPLFEQVSLDEELPALDACALDVLYGDLAIAPKSCEFAQLAAMLRTGTGVRRCPGPSVPVQRWASTAGNLGSVESYLVVDLVRGLQSGMYFYQPRPESLAHLDWNAHALSVDELIRCVSGSAPEVHPNALVILTGAFHRLLKKYGPFGYRLLNLDAGVSASQIQIVGQSLGLRVDILDHWPDDVIEHQCRLDRGREQVTTVLTVSVGSRRSGRSLPERRRRHCPTSHCSVSVFRNTGIGDLVERVIRESRVTERALNLEPSVVMSDSLRHRPESTPDIPLPAHLRAGPTLGGILACRRSVRHFDDRGVSMEQLSTILKSSRVANYVVHGDSLLEFIVVAQHVEGLEPGVYRYISEHHGLSRMLPLPQPHQLAQLFIQRECASAPLHVWVTGDLGHACAERGAFGHRQLLLRGGTAVHRLSMAAMAAGLSGSIIAGLVAGAARALLKLDGYDRAPLVAFVTGYGAHGVQHAS